MRDFGDQFTPATSCLDVGAYLTALGFDGDFHCHSCHRDAAAGRHPLPGTEIGDRVVATCCFVASEWDGVLALALTDDTEGAA